MQVQAQDVGVEEVSFPVVPPSFFKRFCPQLAVYVPKYVCIHNSRVGLLNWILSMFCIAFTVYYIVANDKYFIFSPPSIQITMCGAACAPSPDTFDSMARTASTQPYCKNINNYNSNGTSYTGITCASRCGTSPGSSTCIFPQETIQVSDDEAFVPTFYKDTHFETSGNRTANYFVAGAESARLVFDHEFYVMPYANSLDFFTTLKPLKAHSAAFHSQGWSEGYLTVLFNQDGSEQMRWLPTNRVNVSLADLLRSAYYDKVDADGPLTLDSTYLRPEVGVVNALPLRLTGAAVTIDMYVTDRGQCWFYDTFRKKVKSVTVSWNGPVACMFAHADRAWTSATENTPIGLVGTSRERLSNGVRIKFRTMGRFGFFDEQAFITNLTVFFVWITIPLAVTYWVVVTCLGHLSDVYSRVLHQDLNLKEACKGLAARLASHSAAFMDLKDKEGGLSKKRIMERFRYFLENNESIDDDELSKFVDFVYRGLKSFLQEGQPHSSVVSVQEFCGACASNEPLTLTTLVSLFDKDRQMGCIESVFLDDTIRQVHTSAAPEVPGGDKANNLSAGKDEDMKHSRLLQAYVLVQDMIDSLSKMQVKGRAAAKELDVGPEVLELFGDELTRQQAEALTFVAPPKLDQRESFISIADEDEPGRRRTELLSR